MSESKIREAVATFGKSIFARGLTFGATGNISVKVDGGWIMTPTGSSLGDLDPSRLSKLDDAGVHIGGDKPTKEAFLHMAMYQRRTKANAVVHLHSSCSAAVSCLADLDRTNVLPPLTAYFVMRVGTLPLVPYHPPGDIDLARAVGELASNHHAVLLANHGPVVAGKSLEDAVYATEELEETAKLFLMLKGMAVQPLTEIQVAELKQRFPPTT